MGNMEESIMEARLEAIDERLERNGISIIKEIAGSVIINHDHLKEY